MPNKNEILWFKNTMEETAWPSPSIDLRERIMTQVYVPPPYQYLSTARASALMMAVFLVAFCFGLYQENALSVQKSIYVEAPYYGVSGFHLAQLMGS